MLPHDQTKWQVSYREQVQQSLEQCFQASSNSDVFVPQVWMRQAVEELPRLYKHCFRVVFILSLVS